MNQRIGQLRCGDCEAVFNKQSSLSRHEKIHWAALRCGKDGCEKAFSSHKHLYKHLKRHSDTNLIVRIVPFNIRTKIEVKQELGDDDASVQQLKSVKKEEGECELRVKIEVKAEHDQTGEKEFDRSHQAVRGLAKKCVKKEKEDDDDFCGCKECIAEKMTSDDDDRVLSGTFSPLLPVPPDEGHFETGHSQIGLDGDTPSNSTSLYQLIGGEKLDTKLWLRGVINGLVDPMIDSLFYRLIRSSSTASIAPRRSSTVLKLCQLIEEQKEKTYRLLQIDMDQVVNSLFLRLTNKALVNLYLDRSMEVGYSSQVVNPSNQVESSNAQSHQQSSFITQPSTSSTSSFNPHQTHVSELMFQLIAAERVDLKLWLRGEMENLADQMADSLFFNLIMLSLSTPSVAPQRNCSTVFELCQLMEGEEKKMNSSLRNEIDRLVNSLLERLTNKLLVRTAGSGNVDPHSQVNLLNYVEWANLESHQAPRSIPQPSSSTSVIDEFEPEVIGETEEGNVKVLENVPHYTSKMNQQSELLIEFDEYEQNKSYQDGHITLSHQVKSNSSSINDHNNTNDEGLVNQTIQDDQQPNGQVNNAIDTRQNWGELEIEEEGDDEQMQIEDEEDEETEIDSDNGEGYENDHDDESSLFVANPPIDTTLASNLSLVMIQLARLPKRKRTEKYRNNQEDTEEVQEEVPSRSVKRSRPHRPAGYIHQHKTQVMMKCNYPDCHYETLKPFCLKRHQLIHLGIKPYTCKWSKCDYASHARSETIRHIRQKHFNGKLSSSICFDDYVELNEKLLDNFDGHDANWNVYRTKEKQIITHTLQCPQCDQTFSKHEFPKHMRKIHLIGPVRCLVKDCRESFSIRNLLGQHIAQSHQSTAQWHCDRCDKHFPSYKGLSSHNIHHHQIGHFQCSFPACTFTGDYKKKVFTHYDTQHKTKALRKWQHPGCQYETLHKSHLKRHQRLHFGSAVPRSLCA